MIESMEREIRERLDWLDGYEELPVDDVLVLARERESARGLPRPIGLPPGGWYSIQVRRKGLRYLFWRWVDEQGRNRSRSLGRL